MITNEFLFDSTETTVLDPTGYYDDIKLIQDEECVMLYQVDEEDERVHIITLSPEQWNELLLAIQLPEGAFIVNS